MHARHYLALILILAPLLTGCGRSANLLAADKPADRAALEIRLKQLLTDRVATAQRARDAMQAAFEAETVPFAHLVTAIDNLWKAELAVANAPDERIAAHKKHVESFGQLEDKIEVLYNEGRPGGAAEVYATAQYNRQCAEIALIEACIAAGQKYPLPPHPAPTNP